MLRTIENQYEGIVIDTESLPLEPLDFKAEVKDLIHSAGTKKLIWIRIPIEKSGFIPILTGLDFEFHHCDERNLMLVRRLVPDAIVPTTKNFIVGVGAVIIDRDQILVVKDRFSRGYKLPGGHLDKNESIKDALYREVHEETGITVKLESIMNIGHFKNGQFGESNLYIVCKAKALTKEITVNDCSEIIEAKWMNCDAFLESGDTNIYNKSVVRAIIQNPGLKLTEQKIKLRLPDSEVFF